MKAIRRGKMLGHKTEMIGGPWHDEIVFVPYGGTMVFRIGPWHGHYTSAGVWKDVRPS